MKTLLTLTLLTLSSISAKSAIYEVVDLGTLYGGTSRATGLNNNGDVVGTIQGSGYSKPFLYSNGSMQDLGTLGGASGASTGINDSGQVVGWAQNSLGVDRAFLYFNGTMTDLNVVGTGSSYASAINNNGQISGGGGGGTYVFRYTNTSTIDLVYSTNGDRITTTAINLSGEIVGQMNVTATGRTSYSGIRYSPDLTFYYGVGSLNHVIGEGRPSSDANGINDAGMVAGRYNFRAFINTNDGDMLDLGKLFNPGYTYATDINNANQTVGSSASHAFIYEDGAMLDLNLLIDPLEGWTLIEASAINDVGQIVGYGINPDGFERAFLLNPIPEPSALSLLIISSILLTSRKRRG